MTAYVINCGLTIRVEADVEAGDDPLQMAFEAVREDWGLELAREFWYSAPEEA